MSLRLLLGVLAVALALLVVLAWALSATREFGWVHLAGPGLSAAILAVLFFGRSGGQPSRPPD